MQMPSEQLLLGIINFLTLLVSVFAARKASHIRADQVRRYELEGIYQENGSVSDDKGKVVNK